MIYEITPDFVPSCRIRVTTFARAQIFLAIKKVISLDDYQQAGLALRCNAKGRIKSMVVSAADQAVIIHVGNFGQPVPQGEELFKQFFLSKITPVGFNMARMLLYLARDFELETRGVDIGVLVSPGARPSTPSDVVRQGALFTITDWAAFEHIWTEEGALVEEDDRSAVLRAWVSARSAKTFKGDVIGGSKMETGQLSLPILRCVYDVVSESHRLMAAESTKNEVEFTGIKELETGNLEIVNARYKSRIRGSEQTKIIIADSTGQTHTVGKAVNINGRTTTIAITNGGGASTRIKSDDIITVVGRQDPTNAQRAQDEFVRGVLFGKHVGTMEENILIKMIWLEEEVLKRLPTDEDFDAGSLNPSQKMVVAGMLGRSPIVLVHGPPGTGKTTAIAKAAQIWDEQLSPTWIIAHSNVAVKNIAEKLFKTNVDFKILVSKEFHFEWHEHLYGQIEENLIRTDYIRDSGQLQKLLAGSKIILSTLGMLSNPNLDNKGMFHYVPVEKLVIDEASQISILEYLHIFAKFPKLRKVCFFGDPNQLPPHGQDQVPSMQSIFDIGHFKSEAYFLDTQYRMPTFVGNFISQNVYDGRLHSEHAITTPKAVKFVDAAGSEERAGTSLINSREIQAINHLVKTYYKSLEFAIITPYDAQRAAIEKDLKESRLPWESRVFNVDSFQGNEADYVLLSIVRTGLNPGFLKSMSRLNVMLTRCKKGMVIVTSKGFLTAQESIVPETLVGKMAKALSDKIGEENAWVDWKVVADGKAVMPGRGVPEKGARHNVATKEEVESSGSSDASPKISASTPAISDNDEDDLAETLANVVLEDAVAETTESDGVCDMIEAMPRLSLT